MRKLNRLHVAAALLTIVSVVSLLGISLAAGTTGSAATMVTIQNTKPLDFKVWWEVVPRNPIIILFSRTSSNYNTWGRQRMHLLMVAEGLAAGEEIEVWVYGRLYKADMSASKAVQAAHYYLDYDYPTYDTTLYVPSKTFYFAAWGPTTSKISLSFYLSGS